MGSLPTSTMSVMSGMNHQKPLPYGVVCFDMEDAPKVRPSDDQMGRNASLRQLERLTGIGKNMIYRM